MRSLQRVACWLALHAAGLVALSAGCTAPTTSTPVEPATQSTDQLGKTVPATASDTQGPSAPPQAAPTSPSHHATPACLAQLEEDGTISVNGVRAPSPARPSDAEGGRAVTWALDEANVLVALDLRDAADLPIAEGHLWKVPCAAADRASEALYVEGADFAQGAQRRDGRLYFSGPDGVALLEPSDLRITPITEAAWLQPGLCWGAMGGPQRGHDRVVALSDDERSLAIERGGPCGYEADWTAVPVRVQVDPLPDAPIAPNDETRLELPYGVASVVADAGGVLWLGDGGPCVEPGVTVPQSGGFVWRSSDGTHWEPVSVGADTFGKGVVQVLADPNRAGHVVALMAICENGGVGRYGGDVFVTRDGGTTWAALALPEQPEDFERRTVEEGQGVTEIRPDGDDTEHLVLRRGQELLRTRDGGRSWEPLASSYPARPRPDDQQVELGGFRYVATPTGLVREDATGSRVRVYPSAANDLVMARAVLATLAAGEVPAESFVSETLGLDLEVHCGDCGLVRGKLHLQGALGLSTWADEVDVSPFAQVVTSGTLRCDAGCCSLHREPLQAGNLGVAELCFGLYGDQRYLTRLTLQGP